MDVLKLAREAGSTPMQHTTLDDSVTLRVFDEEMLARFAALVVEECAKVCDGYGGTIWLPNDERSMADECAAAIRSLIKPSSPEAQSPDERPL